MSFSELMSNRNCITGYRSRRDPQRAIETLKQGQLLGEQIPGVKYSVFKIRVRNRDIQKGKSGGYRLIYYLQTKTSIVLLIIYSKSDQANLNPEAIRQIIEGEKDD
ncbi:MAG: type II toxin-antitoxin system RelE/ParE family toxin [Cyanobacteria bacterium RI_101]|nr:type II toxin-antitoxin system RelE/ParE family toxin [Cyanobacteria bacterium RI_101]